MADYNEEKTVIVDRDTEERSSPVGWIILLVVALIIAVFLMMGGMRIFNNGTSGGAGTSEIETSSPTENINPTPDATTVPEATNPTGSQDTTE